MHSHKHFLKDYSLQFTFIDDLFINQWMKFTDAEKINSIKNTSAVFILKIAHSKPMLAEFCKRPELELHWTKIWCISYAKVFADSLSIPQILFFPQLEISTFDLARGAYYFNLSLLARIDCHTSFGYSELSLIKLAARHHSIHGIQRYAFYLIKTMFPNLSIEGEDKKELFKELVNVLEQATTIHKSYAYMLLANAYHIYSLWCLENNKMYQAEKWHEAAIDSIDNADAMLDESLHIIHNASMGRGLMVTDFVYHNTKTPAQLKNQVIKKFDSFIYKQINYSPSSPSSP